MNLYKTMASIHCKLYGDLRDLRDGTMDGQTMVEYGLLVALIAVALIVVVTNLGKGIQTNFNNATKALTSDNQLN